MDAARGAQRRTPSVVASRWSRRGTTLWAVANRGDEPYAGPRRGGLLVELPAGGIAAYVGGERVVAAPAAATSTLPGAPAAARPRTASSGGRVPDGFVEAPAPTPTSTAVFRRRETGTYGGAPYVEEWKPLPPRLHDFVEVPHPTAAAPRFAIAVREVRTRARPDGDPAAPATGLDLAEARSYAASVGARLPTEDEWQLAAEAGLLERAVPLVWNWTESEHRDGRTRFAILKGGADWVAEGSDWYVDGGPQEPAYSLKLLLTGAGHGRLVLDRLPVGRRPPVTAKPLAGIRVVEAATLFAAPFAGMLLGDFGAEVIKLEHPRRPDPARGHGPSKDGVGLWFKTLARNKRLATLDLSRPAGAELFLRLAQRRGRRARELPPGHARAVGRSAGRSSRPPTRGSCSRA